MNFGNNQKIQRSFEPGFRQSHGPIVVARQQRIKSFAIAGASRDDCEGVLDQGNF